jgi:GST-like protein
MIDLHYWPTPNGKKVSILLEEAGLAYRVVPCAIGRGEQFSEGFLRISPNNRMPAIVDTAPAGGGAPLPVFESGAILMYLAEKAGRFFPSELHARYQVVQWVIWQMANQGPKFGEAGHFRRLGESAGDQSYALRRFDDEANRLFGVMNARLYESPYLAGDEYTIADMASYPWSLAMQSHGQDLAEFPHVQRWLEELGARGGVQRGMALGNELTTDYSQLTPEQLEQVRKVLYNQRARPVPARRGS